MEWYSLRFQNPKLENKYAVYRNKECLLPTERLFVMSDIVLLGYFLFIKYFLGGWELCLQVLLVLFATAVATHFLLAQFLPSNVWIEHRALCTLLIRFAKTCIFLLAFSFPMASKDESFTFSIWVRSGVATNIGYSFCMPLMFYDHLSVHGFMIMFTYVLTSTGMCTVIEKSSTTKESLSRAYRFIDKIFFIFSDTTGYTSAEKHEHKFLPACEGFLLVFNIFVTFMVPTLILYFCEFISRAKFMSRLSAEDQREFNINSWKNIFHPIWLIGNTVSLLTLLKRCFA